MYALKMPGLQFEQNPVECKNVIIFGKWYFRQEALYIEGQTNLDPPAQKKGDMAFDHQQALTGQFWW